MLELAVVFSGPVPRAQLKQGFGLWHGCGFGAGSTHSLTLALTVALNLALTLRVHTVSRY